MRQFDSPSRVRCGFGLAVAATLLAAALPESASAIASIDPPHTVAVTSSGGGITRDQVNLLAGDGEYLAYAEVHRLGGGVRRFEPKAYDSATERLLVRSTKDAAVIDLGTPPPVVESGFSLVGPILSTVALSSGSPVTRTIYWWDLDTGTSGTLSPDDSMHWVSSSPDGVVLSDGATLYDETTAGTTTTLGAPFGTDGPNNLAATVSDDGLFAYQDVDRGDTEAAFMSWARAGTFNPVTTGTTRELSCDAVNASYAACAYWDAAGEDIVGVDLLALDGSAPTTAEDPNGADFGLDGSTAIWHGGDGLNSLTAGSSTVKTGAPSMADVSPGTIEGGDPYASLHGYTPSLLDALGTVVGIDHSEHHLNGVNAQFTTTHLFTIPRSPTVSNDVDLTTTRVVYTEDRRDGAGQRAFSTVAATVHSGASGVSVNSKKVVHVGTAATQVAASSSLTVYATPHAGKNGLGTKSWLTVVGRKHTDIIHGVYWRNSVQASGHRVLFKRRANYAEPVYVYNANTRKTRVLRIPSPPCCDATGAALDQKYVAFAKGDGSVWRENIVSGHRIRLSQPLKNARDTQVFISDDYVGWSITYGSNKTPKTVNAYRNAQTRSPVVTLNRPLIGLSDMGAILGSTDLQPGQTDIGGVTSAFDLRTYGGTVTPLLPEQYVLKAPDIAGTTMAWIDGHGILKIAPVPAQ